MMSSTEQANTKIKLDDIYVTIPYNEEDIILVREETEQEVKVTVKNRYTGVVLETHGEFKQNLNKTKAGNYFTKFVYSDKTVGPITARLSATVDYYSEYNNRNITNVSDPRWSEISSGNWYLENEYAIWRNVKEGESVKISGTATITVEITSASSEEWSVSVFEALGFSVSGSTEATVYGRKAIEHDFVYSVY